MPYSDHEMARAASLERKRRWRERQREPGWQDGRGRHGSHVRGSRHPRWNDGRMLSEHGYVKVRVGVEHPLADPNGYAYEHQMVWTAARGPVPPGRVLHHANSEKTDNRLENLEILTRGEHATEHNAARPRDDHGRFRRVLDGRTWNEMPHGDG